MKTKLTFEDLYDAYAGDIYRFSYRLSGNRQDAEDITSETFVRAWVRSSSIRTETLKAYLFTIARNLFLDQLRKSRRLVELKDTHTHHAPGPDRALETQMELDRVHQFIQTLSEVDRSAFILRVEQGLSYEEIARVLGLSLSAVKVKVHRIRKKLIQNRAEKEV